MPRRNPHDDDEEDYQFDAEGQEEEASAPSEIV